VGMSSFQNVKISAVATTVPSKVMCIDDEIEQYGGSENQIKRIKKSIGLDKRHVVEKGQTTLDLAVHSAKGLIDGEKLSKEDIDGLIFVTQTPDHQQPSNAAIAHGKLGLSNHVSSFDINLGCSGYVYGLWMAHMMISSGGHKKVLLLAGDTLSQTVNSRDRATAPLFGDAGSATLVEFDSEFKPASYFSLHTDGSGYESIIVPSGGARSPLDESSSEETCDENGNWKSPKDLHMNGGEVFNFAIKVEPAAVTEIIDYAKLSIDEIDYFIFHQANKYIISNIARRRKLPMEKVPLETVSKYGNQSSASIPCTINDALNSPEGVSSKLLLSGFGVGLSWASAIIDFKNVKVSKVRIYE
tara:strand:+ start:7508 stop:8578 length:1071 start_codon:yes stop_codon:yes gene_type:complete